MVDESGVFLRVVLDVHVEDASGFLGPLRGGQRVGAADDEQGFPRWRGRGAGAAGGEGEGEVQVGVGAGEVDGGRGALGRCRGEPRGRGVGAFLPCRSGRTCGAGVSLRSCRPGVSGVSFVAFRAGESGRTDGALFAFGAPGSLLAVFPLGACRSGGAFLSRGTGRALESLRAGLPFRAFLSRRSRVAGVSFRPGGSRGAGGTCFSARASRAPSAFRNPHH